MKVKEKVAFVILHFNNLKDTNKCINSLKKYLDTGSVDIVVVDNGSTKDKLSIIASQNSNPHIHYIISDKNLGFAKGNNIGFKFAKETLKSDIIILTNSDTYFDQKDFIERLYEHYRKGFDVAGPRILINNGTEDQNPIFKVYKTPREVKKVILKFEFLSLLWYLNMDNFFMKKVIPLVKRNKYKDKSNLKKTDFKLHGACLIFANNYIKKFDGLYSDTFMYGEEDFLKYIVTEYRLKMEYLPDLIVFHKGGASTKKEFGVGRKKRKFYYRWNLDSFKKLLSYMKGKEK